MLTNRKNSAIELFLLFILLLAANLTATFRVLWLVPSVIVVQAVIFLLFSILFIWILKDQIDFTLILENLKKNWFLLPFLVYAFITLFWSIKKDITLLRSAILLVTIFMGIVIGVRYSLKEILKTFNIFGIVILFLSLLTIIFLPSYGIMNYHIIQGAWAGFFWHKNHLGMVTVLINLFFLISLYESFRIKAPIKYFWGAMYLVSLYFLIKTDSVGSYLSAIFVHGVYVILLLWMKFRHAIKKRHYIIFLVLVILAAIVLFTNLDVLFGTFNRNTSLTGRLPMWGYVFRTYLQKHPYLGWGFNAFWYEYDHRVDIQMAAGYPDPIVISDNGFIDILINNGYAGLFLFGLFYFGMWYRSLQLAIRSEETIDLLPVMVLAFTLIANVTWSLIFENESFMMLVMVIITTTASVRYSAIRSNQLAEEN